MHADATSSAVFHHMGVIMLTVSLTCDGAISNMSETMMSQYGIGQDEFIFRMYSIALLAITLAAAVKGDLKEGIFWMFQSGTYAQYRDNAPMSERVWSVHGKILVMVLFSSMGFFGSSCSAAITKNFGALTMSITSTARKATTLFLSFFLFNNVCTSEHIAGIILFISALTTKSLRRRNNSKGGSDSPKRKKLKSSMYNAKLNPNPNVQINAVVEVMQRPKSPGRNNAKKRTTTDKLLVAPGMDPTVPATSSGVLNTNLVHVV
jgi:adenosine 3'-phospho 5'-phosphosulfate transporter B3